MIEKNGLWDSVLFGLEQNFAFWVILLGLLHFPWIHPIIALPILALAAFRWYAGSPASKLTAALFGAAAVGLHVLKQYEWCYFVLGIYPVVILAAHAFFGLSYVISRRSLARLPALLSLLALYPGSFYVLHEPGLPVPAMFTASGFIYLPFLPIYYVLLKNQSLFFEVIKWLNW